MGKVSLGNILRDKERGIYKAIYEEIKENLVDINMQRQKILETRKKLNKRMRTLEKSAKNVNLEIVKLKRKYKEKI